MSLSWDEHFLILAQTIANKSKDPSRKFGAVVVDHVNLIRATGFNGPARAIDDQMALEKPRPSKYLWFVHAEANAVASAARQGISIGGCSIYLLETPCAMCAGLIIQSGIIEVVVGQLHRPALTNSPEWMRSQEDARFQLEMAQVGFRVVGE